MHLAYHRKRLADVARGIKLSKALAERERWPRERLDGHKLRLTDALVRHAVDRSPLLPRALRGPGR